MLSAEQLRQVVGTRAVPKYAVQIADACDKWLPEYGISDPKEVACFIATIATETHFRILQESMNYSAERIREVWPSRFKSVAAAKRYARQPKKLANKVYGGRMGNQGRKNAGWDFRGSGPGQVTGYNEFLQVEKETGVEVTRNPNLLRRDVALGVRAMCILWRSDKMAGPAGRGDLKRVRRIWNGGLNGFDEFKVYYARALKIIEAGPASANKSAAKVTKANPASKILPLFRPKQSDSVTAAVMHKFEHLTPSDRRDDAVKILFVRGYYADSMGRKGANDRALYDDACFVISPDGVQPFNANSDPSIWRKRVATIKANQTIRYRPGKHGLSRKDGGYPAFRQDSTITVERDGVGDDTDTPKKRFWCNLHRGGSKNTSSLGCLTLPTHQWDEFHGLMSRLLKKWGQDTFYVTLVEYDGDAPPVTAAQIEVERIPTKQEPADSVVAPYFVMVGVAVAGWWDKLTTWVGGLF